MDPKVNFLFALLGGVIIISLAMSLRSCRSPAIPEYFDRNVSLATGVEEAQREDRLVFALFTADWCPPCAQLKKGALASPSVTTWIRDHAVPVYVDVSRARSGDMDQQVLLTRHRIEALPTVLVLRGSQELGRVSGSVPARELVKWLRGFSDQP
jgi:thiol:disulfide interchange protein